jgi:hypothetical protein
MHAEVVGYSVLASTIDVARAWWTKQSRRSRPAPDSTLAAGMAQPEIATGNAVPTQ